MREWPYGAVAPGREKVSMFGRVRTFVLSLVAAMVGTVATAQAFVPPETTGLTTVIDGLLVIAGAVALAIATLMLFKRGTKKV